ncbi:MAG: hypothetical protein J3R72DRAFT_527776 [Linnemannia gamsii]|nr:MAG: hypothetical protein J3R72DRAFT_527776 [Linnemannia gamsii]
MFTSATAINTTIHRHKAAPPLRGEPTRPSSQGFGTTASAVASASIPLSLLVSASTSANGNHLFYFPPKNHNDSLEKIYCYGCNQTKTRHAFSISQLTKVDATRGFSKRFARSGGSGKVTHQPLCKDCTPAEVTSLKCTQCSRTQSLEMFSKTQRRRQRDGILICLSCREQLDAEGVVVWLEEEGDGYEDKYEEVGVEGYEQFDTLRRGHLRGGGDGGGVGEDGDGNLGLEVVLEVEKGDPDWHNVATIAGGSPSPNTCEEPIASWSYNSSALPVLSDDSVRVKRI